MKSGKNARDGVSAGKPLKKKQKYKHLTKKKKNTIRLRRCGDSRRMHVIAGTRKNHTTIVLNRCTYSMR